MDSSFARPPTVPDWRPGQAIDLSTRKKVVFAHGLGAATGAPTFLEIQRELATLGYGPADFLEVTPRLVAGRPVPYTSADPRGPLARTIAGVRECLRWYLDYLPADQQFHLIGYSLGGLLLIRATADLVGQTHAVAAGRIASILSLNAPLAGLPAGTPGIVGSLISAGRWVPEAERLLDPVIRDLLAEARDPAAPDRRRAEFSRLVEAGMPVTVIGSLDDQVVAPAEVVPDVPGVERIEIVNETTLRPTLHVDRLFDRFVRAAESHGLPVPGLARPGAAGFWFGHSAILADPAALLAVWQQLGRQELLDLT